MPFAEMLLLPKRFDFSYHSEFAGVYTPIIESAVCKEIILNFSEVQYLDSSALGMMVLLQKKFADKDHHIKIKGASGATLDILTMAHMQKLFEFIA